MARKGNQVFLLRGWQKNLEQKKESKRGGERKEEANAGSAPANPTKKKPKSSTAAAA